MPRHRSEENVYTALAATNKQIAENPEPAKGIRKLLSSLSDEATERPYVYLCVSLILFGFCPGLALFVGWIVILGPHNWNSYFYLLLVSQAMTLPLAVSMWLVISDNRTLTRRSFTEKFVRHFLTQYDDKREAALASVERGISSIAIRSSALRTLIGTVLLALLTNVVASSDFQNASWELVVLLAASPIDWGCVWQAVHVLWQKNALGVILLLVLPIFALIYTKYFGIANSWLHSVKLELLDE